MGQFLKLWWMGFWRVSIFLQFFAMVEFKVTLAISFAAAFILRVVFGVTINVWPIWKLIRSKEVVRYLRKNKRFSGGQYPTTPIRIPHPQSQPQAKPSRAEPGWMTGYEPRLLDPIPLKRSPRMHGNPGSGLSESHFSQRNIALGQKGEVNFAKSLSITRLSNNASILDSLDTFWSVAMPSNHSGHVKDPNFKSDIDCIVVTVSTIYLIDLKHYKSGNIAYHTNGDYLYSTNLKTRETDAPKKMTRNMAMAQDRFSKLFPNMRVVSRVVFMPTNNGASQVSGVNWPGNIPAVPLTSMLNELKNASPAQINKNAVSACNSISHLLK